MDHAEDNVDMWDKWIKRKLKILCCPSTKELTVNHCESIGKDKLAAMLCQAFVHISDMHRTVRGLEEENHNMQVKHDESLKTSPFSQISDEMVVLQRKLIESQENVVLLQKQLLELKDKQLCAVTSCVKSSVQETVKEEFKSYSSVVKSGLQEQTSVTPASIVSVVKKVVEEEDRSRNIMVFGLAEEDKEDLKAKICSIMEVIGEKPKMEVFRVGKAKDGRPRPVKVALTSSLIVSEVIAKSPLLSEKDKFNSVFLSPDRSYDQRLAHRTLVAELKRKKADEPNKRHFIRSGIVNSVEKTV